MYIRRPHIPAAAALLAAALAAPATAQNGAHPTEPPSVAAHPAGSITLDGVLDEPVWQTPAPATDFRQNDPQEGQAAQRTEVRFAYDDEALYVGARMYDSLGAAGVTPRLMRRDAGGEGDYLLLTFDTFHDHVGRTVFGINPVGVRYDAGQATSSADVSWDPVWTYEARIDSLGWTAEVRIPLSQLRFPRDPEQSWGLQMERRVDRLNERSTWAFWTKQEAGGPNRYGHLTTLRMTSRPRGYELMPYVLARASYVEPSQPGSPFQKDADRDVRAGLDLRALLSSNLTLTATVNPDFGQVEVDPAVVNLSAFETFFQEKRPFFVEGSGQFGFGGFSCRFCSNADGMSLFYSRRIGRRPQGAMPGARRYTDIPENTDILAAAKVTGRLSSGLQVAVLDAVTAAEHGRAVLTDGTRISRETEPFTNYFVTRLRQTMRGGNVTIGGIATSTLRSFGWDSLRHQIPGHAEAVGFDWNVYWRNRTFNWMGNFAFSNVSGDSLAITRLQTASARYYQRPDRGERGNWLLSTDRYDPSLTALRGFGGYMRVAKDAGDWRWESMVNYRSPGFEVNDVAFLTRTDYAWMNGNLWRNWTRPTRWYRQAYMALGGQQQYNWDGDLTDRQVHGSVGFDWLNYWYSGVFLIVRPETNDDRITRGGPVVRRARSMFANFDMGTDSRKRIAVNGYAGYGWNAEGMHTWETGATLRLRPASNVSLSLGPSYYRGGSRAQFVTRFDDPSATHFFGQRAIVAALTQRTVAMNTRLNWTFTPNLTLELFAQPFIATGQYSRFSEYARPRTVAKVPVDPARWTVVTEDGRETAYIYTLDPADPNSRQIRINNPDFNVQSLRGNAVLRWEWRPGSTLFFVWQQQRSQFDPWGDFDFTRDAPAVFADKPDNVFVIKATYWIGG